MHLLKNLEGAKVLGMGCGDGSSLEYIYNKGASEIYGIDISDEQIQLAKEKLPESKNNFIVCPMEDEANIKNNYFDYVVAVFSIGYTSDLHKTLLNAYNYLNESGSLTMSWTHPFYHCLCSENSKAVVKKSYFNEDPQIIEKGADKIEVVQKNLMISTIINTAADVGFYVERMYEEKSVLKENENGFKSYYWKDELTENCPSTIIFKFTKLKK
jgi:ubiquinone/menaquinone biosynthesis C-methylase UbiE